MGNNVIWYHADDFGVTLAQSEKILACYRDGALNSIGVIPNVPDLGGVLEILENTDKEFAIRRSLHLNFVEGKPLAGAENVPLLVDKRGYFDKSFEALLIKSIIAGEKKKKKLKAQIKAEIAAQLRAVVKDYDFKITAVDSHRHYHMIPLVFDSLMEVLEQNEFADLGISCMRVPVDPLYPALATLCRPSKIKPVNLVKWMMLKALSRRCINRLKKKGIEIPVFFGILYTCEMKWDIVSALLPAYKAYAEKRNASLELMFHPGNLTAEYEMLDAKHRALWSFYTSDERFFEAECIKMLRRSL